MRRSARPDARPDGAQLNGASTTASMVPDTTPGVTSGAASLASRLRAVGDRIAQLSVRLGLTPRLVRVALAIFLGSRLTLVGLTIFSLIYMRVSVTPANMLAAWHRFDASIYASIAIHGYSPANLYRTAFFPLEPLLAWMTAPLTGGNTAVSAILVSNVAFIGALLGMAALARNDQNDAAAIRAMLLLTFYPLAFFTFLGYSESVFLFCIIWALVAIRREWWVAAYTLGVFAGLARQVGLMLTAPYALAQYKRARGSLRNLTGSALGIVGAPLGVALFCVVLWQTVGDPLAWMHSESIWKRSFAPFWVGFARTVEWALHSPDAVLDRRAFIELGLATLFAALIVVGARRLPPGETLFSIATWLICVSFPDPTYGLISLGRYLLAVVPCFLTLALITRRRWAFALTFTLFAASFLYLAMSFFRGHPII